MTTPVQRLVVFSANGHRWGFEMSAVRRFIVGRPPGRCLATPRLARCPTSQRSLALVVHGEERCVAVGDDVDVVRSTEPLVPRWLARTARDQRWLGIAFAEGDDRPIFVLDHEQLESNERRGGPS